MQPLTCVPEADETKTMTVAWPHHACMPLSEQRQHRAARSTCGPAFVVRSSRHTAIMVFKSRSSFSEVVFTQVLIHLLQPII